MAVVMRVTTLKASGDRLAGMLAYYAGLAEDGERGGAARGPVDYYLDPDEPPGRWWGSGRGALGLDGEVTGDALRAVLDARHPAAGVGLGRSFGDTSVRGFDATFSAPKSVSALWALTPDPWVRAEVLAAHDTAVAASLGWFERMARSPVGAEMACSRSTARASRQRCSGSTRRERWTRSCTRPQ